MVYSMENPHPKWMISRDRSMVTFHQVTSRIEIGWKWIGVPADFFVVLGCFSASLHMHRNIFYRLVGGLVAINFECSQKYWVAHHPN